MFCWGPIISLLTFVALITGFFPVASFAADRGVVVVDSQIAVPAVREEGTWRTKTQSVFEPIERTLIRRIYTVWDPMPSHNLDFTWIPDSVRNDKEGKMSGVGRLIWRLRGQPAYDRASIFAEYRGGMKDGRAEGQGSYIESHGISYQGDWKDGVMEGSGRLELPDGDEYIGQLRGGKANGSGRYVEATGEIYEGYFVDGRRDGIGTTTLPNGNGYRANWLDGKETEDSRQLRLAQSSGPLTRGAAEDVRIGITIDKSKARDGDLVYATSSAGTKLVIEPDNKRLMSMWKGNGEIQLKDDYGDGEYGVFSLSRGQLFPLTIVLQVENRSAAPIALAGAYLGVASSVSDLQPAIQIDRQFGIAMCSADYKPTFRVDNFGWGAAEHATMHFAFAGSDAGTQPSKPNLTKGLENIERGIKVDVGPELRAAGVDLDALDKQAEHGFICESKSTPACLQQIKASGLFGSLASKIELENPFVFVHIIGTLDYNWNNSKGARRDKSSPFDVKLLLGHTNIGEECGNAGDREVFAKDAIAFKLDQSDYRLQISSQRSVAAGRTSQFTVTVTAAKSSQHDFTVVLQLADGREISSRPISLLYYRPSWFRAN